MRQTLLALLLFASVAYGQYGYVTVAACVVMDTSSTEAHEYRGVWLKTQARALVELWDSYKAECATRWDTIPPLDLSAYVCVQTYSWPQNIRLPVGEPTIERHRPDPYEFLDSYLRRRVQ